MMAWLNIHLTLPRAKNGLLVCCTCLLQQLIVSCSVDPVQCTEEHDLEQEVTVPITRQPTKGKLRRRLWCFITSANKVRMANLDPCDKRCKLIFSFHLAFRLKTYLKKLELKTKHKEQKRKEPTKENSLYLLSLCEYS